jgi:hypothetical protein
LYLKADTAFDHTSFVEERYAVIVSSLCDANFFRDAEPMFGLSVDAHDSSFDTEGGSQGVDERTNSTLATSWARRDDFLSDAQRHDHRCLLSIRLLTARDTG